MSNITIIDAGCGKGKTEYIIRYMNSHQDRPYLYISPLREMFNRLRGEEPYEGRGAQFEFYTPGNDNFEGLKLRSLKNHMIAGDHVMSTHSLFLALDEEAADIINAANYHLIIDEDLNAVSVLSDKYGKAAEEGFSFHELQRPLNQKDMNLLKENGFISIDENNYNRVNWIKDTGTGNYRYQDVERMIKTGAVSYVDKTFIVWSFPIRFLDAFQDITILTYRFGHSILKAYLDFYDKPYEHKTIVQDGNGYRLTDYDSLVNSGSEYAELIHIFDNPKLNAIGAKIRGIHNNTPLSKNWYQNHPDQLRTIQNNTYNYFYNYMHATADNVMWTTYKDYKKKVQPRSYRYAGRDPDIETFVPCNCRATEAYAGRHVIAYLIDRYLHPGIEKFFQMRGITVEEDEFALSELLQWLFRSAVRRGEEIDLYIPSTRMRSLLQRWLA